MRNLDLNLLVALDALLTERSVTRAAERLGLSQPTLSVALGRLRRHFGDPLLERVGHGYRLTPLALQLADRSAPTLDSVQRLFALEPAFDPATSTREFVLLCSDYAAALVGPLLVAALTERAPGVTLNLRHEHPGRVIDDESLLRSVDGIVMPHGFVQSPHHLDVYRDRWVCLVSRTNVDVGDELGPADLSRLEWVFAFSSMSTRVPPVSVLAQAGVQIRARIAVNTFLQIPLHIAGSDRVALVPGRVPRLVPHPDVRVLECSPDPGPLIEAFWWHRDVDRDTGHIWFRELLATVTEPLRVGADGRLNR
ncbi:LysR family transcriptional regulator [uncultured Friedmanniella sp.]|uniref:LysR family transcriptional regulator n=1 Tax=uncultured Friedmanniella sp. TaxID=335381 RepID=UPI0035C9F984